MVTGMQKLLVFILVLWGIAMPCVAGAQPRDHLERQQAYNQGKAAVTAGDWQAALAIFNELWTEQPTYDVALMLGQVELALERYRDAAEHLSYGLDNLPPREKTRTSERSAEFLRVAKSHVGTLTIRVDKPHALVTVNGRDVGRSPLSDNVFTEPGPQRVAASLDGGAPVTEIIKVAAGEEKMVNLALEPTSPTHSESAHKQDSGANEPWITTPHGDDFDGSRQDAKKNHTRLIASGTIAAVGLGALGAGVVFHAKAAAAEDDVTRLQGEAVEQFGPGGCAAPPGQTSAVCKDVRSAGNDQERAGKTANVLYVTGGALVAGAAVTYLLWPKQPTHTSTRITPTVTGKGGGLVVTGNF